MRERYDGAALALAAAILPCCMSPAWLRYDERATARVNRKGIEQHGTLLAKLVRLQPNLAFKQSSMEAAMRIVVEEKRGSWDLQSDAEKVWVAVNAKRLRAMAMHVRRGKKKKTAWVLALIDDVASPQLRGAQEVKTGGFHGWDPELRAAWRLAAGQKSKDLTKDIFAKMPSQPTDFVWARFSDGDERPLTDVTVADWHMLTQATDSAKHARKAGLYWFAMHKASDLPLEVKPRADREQLMSLYWGEKQVCQVKTAVFERPEQAFTFMVDIGQRFATGELDKEGLFAARAEGLQKLGLASQARATLKRPAGVPLRRPASCLGCESGGSADRDGVEAGPTAEDEEEEAVFDRDGLEAGPTAEDEEEEELSAARFFMTRGTSKSSSAAASPRTPPRKCRPWLASVFMERIPDASMFDEM